MNYEPPDDPLIIDQDNTPPRGGPEIYILRLGADQRLGFVVFSRALFGVWVHFDQKAQRSSPHYKKEERCPGCQDNTPKRWKGFVHAYCQEKKQEVFLELTPASANALLSQLAQGETLRGKHLFVQRSKGKNGRLSVRVLQGASLPETLPEEKDPMPSLCALWGVNGQRSGVEFPCSGFPDPSEKA